MFILKIILISVIWMWFASGLQVRLSGGGHDSGRVEVRRHSYEAWGTVCDDSFNITDAHVVCRMLGFTGASRQIQSFGGGTGEIYLDEVNCVGYETDLVYCQHDGWAVDNCAHYEDVGVECSGSAVQDNRTQVRLVGGTQRSGRVEVRRTSSEAWGTVCDHYWEQTEANVVCKMLGFRSSLDIMERNVDVRSEFGAGSDQIYLDRLKCHGNEADVLLCSSRGWGVHSCDHSLDVGVHCSGLEIRLQGTNSNNSAGRVEIRRSSQENWGTVCDDYWDDQHSGQQNADVVCKMLGFHSAEAVVLAAGFGQGFGDIYLDDIRCNGSEADLFDCPSSGWRGQGQLCSHSEDVGVICRESAPPTQPTTTVEIVHPAAADESDAGQDITFDDGRYSADTEGSNSPVFPDSVISVPMNRSTETAVVDLHVYQVIAKFTQTFGQHSLTLTSGDREFSVNINVYDPAVVRRLLFHARYSLRCDLLEQNLTHHLIEITARGGVHHIREICDGDCSDFDDPRLSCENGVLTIEWLTNVTYSARVTRIPYLLAAKLSENIRHKGAILLLVVHADNHSIERPILDIHGLSLRPMLHSGCIDESMTYDSTLDKCLGD